MELRTIGRFPERLPGAAPYLRTAEPPVLMIFWTVGGRLAHYALRSLSSRRCEMPDGAIRPRLVDPALLAVRSRIRKPPFRFRQRSTFCSAPRTFRTLTPSGRNLRQGQPPDRFVSTPASAFARVSVRRA